MLYKGYVFVLFSIWKFSIWKVNNIKSNLLHNSLIDSHAKTTINTLFFLSGQIIVLRLIFHPIVAFWALQKKHFLVFIVYFYYKLLLRFSIFLSVQQFLDFLVNHLLHFRRCLNSFAFPLLFHLIVMYYLFLLLWHFI